MSEHIDADDLAMLATGFAAAMTDRPGPAEADDALFELGWAEVLDAAPVEAARMAFTSLGASGSAASLLDDVVCRALGLDVSATTCVVLPRPHRADAPAHHDGGRLVAEGLVSARVDAAKTAVLATGADAVAVDAATVRSTAGGGIDPGRPFRRVSVEIAAGDWSPRTVPGSWEAAVAAARIALAHQLIGAARWMLDEARQHALDRVQFGRPVASFQALRHKLAESLVAIEGAASVADAWTVESDPLIAALAKSLAGRAARTTATHTQQVLAGIGFTTEHRFHRWLKRVLVVDTLFGSSTSLPADIGRELLRRGEAPRLIEL